MITETSSHAYGQIENHKQCRTWADREKDFKFFTPGLLYWRLMVDRDLVEEYIEKEAVPKSLRPKRYVSDIPMFDVDPPTSKIYTPKGELLFDISRTIYICPRQSWDALDKFIMTSGFVEPKSQLYAQAMKQNDITLPDFAAMKQCLPSTPIQVAVYGIYTNSFCSIWREKPSEIFIPPKACILTPSDVVIEDGKKFFEGKN